MPFAPIAMIARFAGVSDTIRALMSNKEDTDAALRQDFFYSKLYSIVWSSALSFVDLRGVALKKAWSFSKDDGPHKRLFIISFMADMASGQEPFPMTMISYVKAASVPCAAATQIMPCSLVPAAQLASSGIARDCRQLRLATPKLWAHRADLPSAFKCAERVLLINLHLGLA